ncbi:MAG: hypothetical protein ACP5NV_02830 [Candidatus Woesearchaeota archaeon]
MKKTILLAVFLTMFLITVYNVHAAAFTYEYDDITDSIFNNESAYYAVTLNNNNNYQERFQFYTISAFWDISPTIVQVMPSSSSKITLEITPLDSKIYGPQLVPITIKSLTDEWSVVENFYVYIKPSNYTPKEYVPNVAMEVRMSDEADPRTPLSLEVYMRNRNPLNLDKLRIVVESELFNKEYQTTLGSLEEKTNQILFVDLDPLQKPGTYNVHVALIYNDEIISQSNRQLIIKEYSDIQVEQKTIRGLFYKTEEIELYNDGNSETLKEVKIKRTFLQKIFTTSTLDYESTREDGVSYISWNVPLKPRESYTLKATTNYSILFIIIFAILIVTISYFIFRSPVIMFKKGKISADSEHGITDIKIRLHIKNRSGKTIRNIKIIDKYPKLTTLVEDSSLGVLKPTKLTSTDKSHNLLSWNLEVLDPYEERLIVYKLKSSLNIVGNVSLPPSKIRFHTATGERSYVSNSVVLLHRSHQSLSKKTDDQ